MKVIECLNEAINILKENNDTDYEIDAKILLEYVLKANRTQFLMLYQNEMKKEQCKEYMRYVKIRATGKPLAYILGYKYFMDNKFYVSKGILIPRDDTEVVVRKLIDGFKNINMQELNILDMCTGSGCIAISLAKNIKKSKIIGIDISRKAINMSNKNKIENGVADSVKFIRSNLFNAIDKVKYYDMFDIIVSNPPYIKTDIINTLDKDVKDFEPKLALDGGKDGLIFYEKIVKESSKFLKDGGILAFEIDYTYTEQIVELLKNNSFSCISVYQDISGKDRAIIANVRKNKYIQ